jgi:hypothetical protein
VQWSGQCWPGCTQSHCNCLRRRSQQHGCRQKESSGRVCWQENCACLGLAAQGTRCCCAERYETPTTQHTYTHTCQQAFDVSPGLQYGVLHSMCTHDPSHRCPSCQALIEKVPAASGTVQCTCNAVSSSAHSRCRCEHKQQHRLRCTACSKDFCDACWSIPYHEGLNCQEAAAPHCLLCDTLLLAAMDLQVSFKLLLQPPWHGRGSFASPLAAPYHYCTLVCQGVTAHSQLLQDQAAWAVA